MSQIIFFLMSQKGFEALTHYVGLFGPQSVRFVVGASDQQVEADYFSEIREFCKSNAIQHFDRKETYEIDTPYCLAISWRWIIEPGQSSLIVLHDSLLPKYRGFAPLVNCLVNGETEIGVTALLASESYDQGDIIAQERISVSYPITIQEAINNVSVCYKNLVETIGKKVNLGEELVAKKQDETKATYSLWLDEADYAIDWNQSAEQIKRFIDAVGFPYHGASTLDADRKLRVLEAVVVPDVIIENRSPGKIIFITNGKPVIVCGSGLLQILQLKDDSTGHEILPLKRFRTRFV